jgi:hypothetical protein
MLRSGQILNVHVARPKRSRTHDERTCQVGLRPPGKGGNLFVARGNPINDLQLPQCLDGPIQRVTDPLEWGDWHLIPMDTTHMASGGG